jgi:transcriptional regulator with XRE-family HTH domain
LRKAQHLSQEEFAEKSGKMVNTISKIERGIGDPKITTLRDIALGLDIDLLELLALDGQNRLRLTKSNERVIGRIDAMLQTLDERTLQIIEKQIEVFYKLR